MGKLSEAQEKLLRKVRERKDLWVKMVREVGADHFLDNLAEVIADELGLPKDTVKKEMEKTDAYKEYAKFASDPEKYVSRWLSHIERAIKEGKWLKKYIAAFYPPAAK